MASANSWKLRALLKKNLLILKRNIISTIFEILFPIVLILLCYAIRKAFTLQTFLFNEEEEGLDNYIQNKSVIYKDFGSGVNIMDYVTLPKKDEDTGLSIIPTLKICSMLNSKYKPRPIIASVGVPEEITNKIKDEVYNYNINAPLAMLKLNIDIKKFESVDKLEEYVKDKNMDKKEIQKFVLELVSKKKVIKNMIMLCIILILCLIKE